MSTTMSLKAVIFDLDGVLVSTSKFHAQAWEHLVRSQGYEPPADLEEQVRGISRMASLKIALGAHATDYTEAELEALAAQKNAMYLEATKGIAPSDLFPGVIALFDSLKAAGIKICLGSASKNAKPVLENLGILHYFDAIADGFCYKHGKPHPDVFLCSARMAGTEAEACIVVEDAAAGISAALDGGFVAVGMGQYASLKHAHLFINNLEEIDAARLQALHARHRAGAWSIQRDGIYDEKREESLHTLYCTGNGFYGIRGNLAELPLGEAQGSYLAGFFDTIDRPGQNPEQWSPFMHYWGVAELSTGIQREVSLANCPDFLDMELVIEGEPINFTTGEVKSFQRRLDLASGMFTVETHWVSPGGRELRLVQRRFADMAYTDHVYVQYELEPLNFSGTLRIAGGIDTHTEQLFSQLGVQQTTTLVKKMPVHDQAVAVLMRGNHLGMEAAFAVSLSLPENPLATYQVTEDGSRYRLTSEVTVTQDQLLHIERVIVAATARRTAVPLAAVCQSIATPLPFAQARIDSTSRWRQLWRDSDILIEGSDEDQIGARNSIYHLLIAASQDDPGVSIAAKSLTGEGYRGMVFWDTDIHMTPFFNFTQPAIARNLAMFRYLTLDGARRKAVKYGNTGASYPWETGISGEEECEKWLKLITHQLHITADVAYALQQYVDATGDMDFYANAAAEVMLETARFWISKSVQDGEGLMIPQAGGPDEYHVDCDDSAYVNHLAIYNLRTAQRALDYLRQHAPEQAAALIRKIGMTEAEIAALSDYPNRIHTMQGQNGLLEQCRGFFGLRDEFAREGITPDPHNTQSVKQADVMMLLYLLPDQWTTAQVRANWDYYEPRTVHASSLSHAVHGILALELGIQEKVEGYIRSSLGMDLHDEMGNTGLGVHMAANGMNWAAIVRGYGGARTQGEHFLINPHLPQSWQRLEFTLKWRGADFTVDITPEQVTITNLTSATAALPVVLCGQTLIIAPGQTVSVPAAVPA